MVKVMKNADNQRINRLKRPFARPKPFNIAFKSSVLSLSPPQVTSHPVPVI